MLFLSEFWLQGLLIVIVPQPFFTQSNVNQHDNKFCLIATVFLGKATAFISSLTEGIASAKDIEACKSVANEVTAEKVAFLP